MNSFTLYPLNRYVQNPAAAGTKPYLFISTSFSRYWSGINGAPEIQAMSAHSLLSQRTAIGFNLLNENTGLSGKTGAEFSYAYHLPISSGGTKLSFGLSALVSQYKMFTEKFVVDNIDDELIKNSENSIIVPDAAFGMSLYQENKFFVDFSIRQLLGRSVNFVNPENLENKQIRHYSLGLGCLLSINENIEIEPSALLKASEAMVVQADLGARAIFNKSISIGCYYRTNDGIFPFIGYDTKNIMFAYSYGVLMGDVANYSTGSHEIMLILKLNYSKSNLE
ncbi:MAG: hypothetical protein A2W98_12425 [Bacteroidetes bacterium GWF2_33_38]|nr:MAG: hypothetical protein A2W98_12425 [Bacteroidetes bacterium GWF2_33_38]OFY72910.1 MAG: hypothetical protein A2265_08575 [Bacteroidetes bacterium RIFOXYA12_FULL_33_9]OFY92133.1 MAG: hypothetical protein A2236_01645 [Bacteroidetes bacterium RIFOXYA2_FULL_33_7]